MINILQQFSNDFNGNRELIPRIFKRCLKLRELYFEDENNFPSDKSLILMLEFLKMIKDFSHPVIALNSDGKFHLSWRHSDDNLLIIRFNETNIDYVIFTPIDNSDKPRIIDCKSVSLIQLKIQLDKIQFKCYL